MGKIIKGTEESGAKKIDDRKSMVKMTTENKKFDCQTKQAIIKPMETQQQNPHQLKLSKCKEPNKADYSH